MMSKLSPIRFLPVQRTPRADDVLGRLGVASDLGNAVVPGAEEAWRYCAPGSQSLVIPLETGARRLSGGAAGDGDTSRRPHPGHSNWPSRKAMAVPQAAHCRDFSSMLPPKR